MKETLEGLKMIDWILESIIFIQYYREGNILQYYL